MPIQLNIPDIYYPNESQSIEMFVQDNSARNKLRDDLIPIRKYGSQKINLAFVLNVVNQFIEEISKKKEYFANISIANTIQLFSKAAAQILELNPTLVSVQVTDMPGIYILAEINGQHLHIDINFNEGTGRFEEAIANIFSNKTQKLNVFGTMEEVSGEIEKYFEPDPYENFVRTSYAIPGQTYSSHLF